eukprot:4454186-Pyramimonas_sp.AAC.1
MACGCAQDTPRHPMGRGAKCRAVGGVVPFALLVDSIALSLGPLFISQPPPPPPHPPPPAPPPSPTHPPPPVLGGGDARGLRHGDLRWSFLCGHEACEGCDEMDACGLCHWDLRWGP